MYVARKHTHMVLDRTGLTHQLADATPRADDERHTMFPEATVDTQMKGADGNFFTSLRGRFKPIPHNASLQNLQAHPGTTIYVCAIAEDPGMEKIVVLDA